MKALENVGTRIVLPLSTEKRENVPNLAYVVTHIDPRLFIFICCDSLPHCGLVTNHKLITQHSVYHQTKKTHLTHDHILCNASPVRPVRFSRMPLDLSVQILEYLHSASALYSPASFPESVAPFRILLGHSNFRPFWKTLHTSVAFLHTSRQPTTTATWWHQDKLKKASIFFHLLHFLVSSEPPLLSSSSSIEITIARS